MGIQFPDDLKEVLKKYHQEKASDIQPGFWHCFDLPFEMVCGNMDIAQLMYDKLSPMSGQIKEALHISIVKQNVGYTNKA